MVKWRICTFSVWNSLATPKELIVERRFCDGRREDEKAKSSRTLWIPRYGEYEIERTAK